MSLFLNLWLKLFFVFTPFFGLSMFLSMTEGYDETQRRKLALTTSTAVGVSCLILLFAGSQIFAVFGITLNSFRIGAGVLLFLSGLGLVQGRAIAATASPDSDVSVVPLAIPIIVGPATIGTLIVMGAELNGWLEKLTGTLSLLTAVVSITLVLCSASAIHRRLGARGIAILSKLTGLILVALASQMVMTGIQGFLGTP